MQTKHQKQINKGDLFCDYCGGTGRTETGCQPCPKCPNPFMQLLSLLNGEDPNDNGTHRHKCECGFIWEHENNCSMQIMRTGGSDNKHAHTCRQCGKEMWEKYFGENSGVFVSCAIA